MRRRVSQPPPARQADERQRSLFRMERGAPATRFPSARRGPPVDSPGRKRHFTRMSKKPHKVEESAASYVPEKSAAASPSAKAGSHSLDLEKIRATNAKLMQVHHKVLQKLAQ